MGTRDLSEDERPYHHGNLRNSLVEAASSLLEEEGVAALSLRRVARRAGVSHGAPYRHFRDKHELLEAVAAAGFRSLEERFAALAEQYADDPRRQIVESGCAYMDEVLTHPERAHLMFGRLLDPSRRSDELAAAQEQSFAQLIATVRRGEGTLFRDLPTRELALALWASSHGLSLLASADQLQDLDREGDPKALARRMVENLLAGLAEG